MGITERELVLPRRVEEAVVRCFVEHRSDPLITKSSQSASNAGDLELQFRVLSSIVDEVINVLLDRDQRQRLKTALPCFAGTNDHLFGRDGIAVAVMADAFAVDSAMLEKSIASGTSSVDASLIATETRTPSNYYSWCYSFLLKQSTAL